MRYQSAKELKGIARDKMLGNYGTAIGAFLFLRMIIMVGFMVSTMYGSRNGIMSIALSFIFIMIEGIFVLGELSIYLKISVGIQPSVTDIFSAFKGTADKAIKVRLIYLAIMYGGLFIGEGITILLLKADIPGIKAVVGIVWLVIVAACIYLMLMYSQIMYYILDFTDISVIEACRRSRRLMEGNKIALLMLCLSFIPMYIIGMLSFMVGLYYIHPYVKMTLTEFYLDRVRQNSGFDVSV